MVITDQPSEKSFVALAGNANGNLDRQGWRASICPQRRRSASSTLFWTHHGRGCCVLSHNLASRESAADRNKPSIWLPSGCLAPCGFGKGDEPDAALACARSPDQCSFSPDAG